MIPENIFDPGPGGVMTPEIFFDPDPGGVMTRKYFLTPIPAVSTGVLTPAGPNRGRPRPREDLEFFLHYFFVFCKVFPGSEPDPAERNYKIVECYTNDENSDQ